MKDKAQIERKDDEITAAFNREFKQATDVRDALNDAVYRSGALLEAFALLLEKTDNSEHPQLSDSAVEGLQFLAAEEAKNLRDALQAQTRRLRNRTGRIVAA